MKNKKSFFELLFESLAGFLSSLFDYMQESPGKFFSAAFFMFTVVVLITAGIVKLFKSLEKKPYGDCIPCLSMSTMYAPVGTKCRTEFTRKRELWVRVKGGWQHSSGGPVWAPIPMLRAPLEANEFCKKRGGSMPRKTDFSYAEYQGLREVLHEVMPKNRFFTNDYSPRKKKIGTYSGDSGLLMDLGSCDYCLTICIDCNE